MTEKVMLEYQAMSLPQLQILSNQSLDVQRLNTFYDGTIIIFHDAESLDNLKVNQLLGSSIKLIKEYVKADQSAVKKDVNVILDSKVPGGKLMLAPTGPLLRDQDDVRRYAEAASRSIRRVKAMGSIKRPLLILQPPPFDKMEESIALEFGRFYEVAALAALAETHELLEAREASPELMGRALESLDIVVDGISTEILTEKIDLIQAIETGRRLARDIGGSDPERMTAIKAAEAIITFMKAFENVKVTVIEDQETLKREYPLLAAVARASEHGIT